MLNALAIATLELAVGNYVLESRQHECTRAKLSLYRANGSLVEVIDLPAPTGDFLSPLFASSSLPEASQ